MSPGTALETIALLQVPILGVIFKCKLLLYLFIYLFSIKYKKKDEEFLSLFTCFIFRHFTSQGGIENTDSDLSARDRDLLYGCSGAD